LFRSAWSPGAAHDEGTPDAGDAVLARLAPYLAISAGGIVGAIARYVVGGWAATHWGMAFPWGTLLINVSGSFLLGFYLTRVTEGGAGRATARLFVATGFCGAFTTFSTMSEETVALLQHGAFPAALVYVAASLMLGLGAVVIGAVAARS
jgi:fluoride exporter